MEFSQNARSVIKCASNGRYFYRWSVSISMQWLNEMLIKRS